MSEAKKICALHQREMDSQPGPMPDMFCNQNCFGCRLWPDTLEAWRQHQQRFPYVEGQAVEIFHNGKWYRGKIVAGYRFRDGIVTVKTDDGQTIWCGESRKELYRPVEGT